MKLHLEIKEWEDIKEIAKIKNISTEEFIANTIKDFCRHFLKEEGKEITPDLNNLINNLKVEIIHE